VSVNLTWRSNKISLGRAESAWAKESNWINLGWMIKLNFKAFQHKSSSDQTNQDNNCSPEATISWMIKCNIDGATREAPIPAAYACIYQGSSGEYIGGFSEP